MLNAATVGGFVAGVVMLGVTSYVPVYAQQVLGAGATVAGFAVAALAIGWPFAASTSGRIYLRWGFRACLFLGALFGAAGATILTQVGPGSSILLLAAACLVLGLGLGYVVSPSIVAMQSAVEFRQRGVATGANMFSRSVGSAVGVAMFGAIANGVVADRLGGADAAGSGEPRPAAGRRTRSCAAGGVPRRRRLCAVACARCTNDAVSRWVVRTIRRWLLPSRVGRMKRDIYDEDHESFRESARTWIERSVTPNAEKYIQDKSLPREFWLEAGAQGMLGLAIPEEYGGAGADDFRFNAVLTEEMAKVGAWMPTCVGIHADITAPYIVELGTEEQKQRWLPGVASGEILLGIGMTEPSGGSDLAALKTTAVRDGDEWVINGSKTFITNGFSGDLIITAARTDPEKGPKGITLFGIEATKEGFSRGRKLDKVGMEESDTSELFFENVRVHRRRDHRRAQHGLRPHDAEAPAGADRLRGRQHPPREADPGRDHPVRQGPAGVRPVDRPLPAHQVPAGRAGHRGRGVRGLHGQVRRRRTPRASSPPSRRPRPSGGPPTCRTRSSTTASRSTAVTAS